MDHSYWTNISCIFRKRKVGIILLTSVILHTFLGYLLSTALDKIVLVRYTKVVVESGILGFNFNL